MQDPLTNTLPVTEDPADKTKNMRPLNRLVERHPYLGTLLLFLIYIGLTRLLGLVLSLAVKGLHLSFIGRNLIGELLAALLVAAFIAVFHWWSETGFTQRISKRGLLLSLLPFTLIALPQLCGLALEAGSTAGPVLAMAISLSLLIGITEEGLFRGLLLRALLPKGIWPAVLISAVLFASVHLFNVFAGFAWNYVLGQVVIAFGSGILFAALRLRSGSIWLPIIFHAIHDAAGIILLNNNPNQIFATQLNVILIVNGIFALLYILNSAYLLRPSQERLLRAGWRS